MSSGLFDAPDATPERRELDRYYTADPVAAALVQLLHLPAGARVVEPSVGGGAWVRALHRHGPDNVHITGVDLDPDARGLQGCDDAVVGVDWTDPSLDDRTWDWSIGNPPYQDAEAHIRASLRRCHNVVALLRLAFLETASRVPFWLQYPPRKVWVLAERPSFTGGGTDSAAYGLFWWRRQVVAPSSTLGVVSWRSGAPVDVFRAAWVR